MIVTHPRSSLRLGRSLRAIATALLASSLLAACGGSGQAAAPTPTPLPLQPAVEKPTYTVERGDIVEELRLSGRVSAVRQDDLSFAQAGNVATVYVRATDVVTKGRLLMELDQGDLLNQLASAELNLERAQLALERNTERQQFGIRRAELDLEEAQARLALATSAGDRQLAQLGVERAELNLEEARASTDEDLENQVAQAQLDYDRIKSQVDAGRLYAPYDGEIAELGVEPGGSVQAYQPVVTIMDPAEREIRVENAISTDLARLSPQQPVTLRFSRYQDTPLEAVIERLPQSATSTQSTVRADTAVHISFDPGDLELDIGDLVEVIVTLQRKENVLWLPPQAVRTFQGRRFVVVQDGDRQRRVDVTLGIAGPDRVEIVEGLEEGQQVIGQ
jgi:RND family efflux transporter MFP subunit